MFPRWCYESDRDGLAERGLEYATGAHRDSYIMGDPGQPFLDAHAHDYAVQVLALEAIVAALTFPEGAA